MCHVIHEPDEVNFILRCAMSDRSNVYSRSYKNDLVSEASSAYIFVCANSQYCDETAQMHRF